VFYDPDREFAKLTLLGDLAGEGNAELRLIAGSSKIDDQVTRYVQRDLAAMVFFDER